MLASRTNIEQIVSDFYSSFLEPMKQIKTPQELDLPCE